MLPQCPTSKWPGSNYRANAHFSEAIWMNDLQNLAYQPAKSSLSLKTLQLPKISTHSQI